MKRLFSLSAAAWLFLSVPSALAAYTNVNQETEALLVQAHKSDSKAMETLGDIYAQGNGVTQDKDEAIRWYSLASELGNDSANEKLWKLEGHADRKVKRIKRAQGYDQQATHDLCTYLHLTTRGTMGNVYKPEAVPKGIKTIPAAGGYVQVEKYKPAVVKRYLKKGADPRANVNIEDIDRPLGASGMTLNPFQMVSRMHDLKTLDLFIAHGCCINRHGNFLAHLAFQELDHGDEKEARKMLDYLLSRGLNLHIRSNWSSTRLIDCACADGAKAITYLIKQGLDPDAELEPRYMIVQRIRSWATGDRALGMAVRNKWIYTIDALIKGKADLNYIWKGKTVLDEALASPGAVDESATSYEEEFKRLDTLMYGPRKKGKSKKEPRSTNSARNTDVSVAHLLRLAGAKTAAELGHKADKP